MRTRRLMRLVITGGMLLAAVPVAEAATILPPTTPIAGVSQRVWADRWWAWALGTTPVSSNPVVDTTGVQSFRGDQGPVFFLAGTFTGSPVTRTATVREDQVLFFPLLNSAGDNTPPITTPPTPPTTFTAQELLNLITPNQDPTKVSLFATLDSVPITNLTQHLQMTDPNDPFSYTVASADNVNNVIFGSDSSNGTGIYPATVFPAVQVGYYLAITGLSPGTHTLTFGGVNATGGAQNNTYNLVVTAVPEPGTLGMAGTVVVIGLVCAWRCRRHAVTWPPPARQIPLAVRLCAQEAHT